MHICTVLDLLHVISYARQSRLVVCGTKVVGLYPQRLGSSCCNNIKVSTTCGSYYYNWNIAWESEEQRSWKHSSTHSLRHTQVGHGCEDVSFLQTECSAVQILPLSPAGGASQPKKTESISDCSPMYTFVHMLYIYFYISSSWKERPITLGGECLPPAVTHGHFLVFSKGVGKGERRKKKHIAGRKITGGCFWVSSFPCLVQTKWHTKSK